MSYTPSMPWHFREELGAREAETLAAGTQMTFPLPSVEVVGAGP